MKPWAYVLIYLAANLASLACVIAAAILALHGISGWGWFLFAGILVAAGPSSKKEEAQQ